MLSGRIPAVDRVAATVTAALAIRAGHIGASPELPFRTHLCAL